MVKRLVIVVMMVSFLWFGQSLFSLEKHHKLLPSWANLVFEIKVKDIVRSIGKEKLISIINKVSQKNLDIENKLEQFKLMTGFDLFNDLRTIIGGVEDYTDNPDFMVAFIGKFPVTRIMEFAKKSNETLNIRIKNGISIVQPQADKPVEILMVNNNVIIVCSKSKTNRIIKNFFSKGKLDKLDREQVSLINNVCDAKFLWFISKIDKKTKKNIPADEGFAMFNKVNFVKFSLSYNAPSILFKLDLVIEDSETAELIQTTIESYKMLASGFISKFPNLLDFVQGIKIEAINNETSISFDITEDQIIKIQNEMQQQSDKYPDKLPIEPEYEEEY